MRVAKYSLALILSIVLSGCGHDKSATQLDVGSADVARSDTLVLGWFLESDGHGHSGYQAAYAASSSATPQTVPFYGTIDEFRIALQTKGMTNIASIGTGYTNGDWRVRGLTADELKSL